MSDFLKNLRTTQRGSHQRHTIPNRRTVDGNYYPQTDRRTNPDRRATSTDSSQHLMIAADLLNESIPIIKQQLSQISTSLEKIAQTKKNLEKSRIDQHSALTSFFENVNQLLCDFVMPLLKIGQETFQESNPQTAGSISRQPTKDEVIDLIRSMRKDRATFAEIALHLKEKGIPTFSGRGEWHAQTIHRICK